LIVVTHSEEIARAASRRLTMRDDFSEEIARAASRRLTMRDGKIV